VLPRIFGGGLVGDNCAGMAWDLLQGAKDPRGPEATPEIAEGPPEYSPRGP